MLAPAQGQSLCEGVTCSAASVDDMMDALLVRLAAESEAVEARASADRETAKARDDARMAEMAADHAKIREQVKRIVELEFASDQVLEQAAAVVDVSAQDATAAVVLATTADVS